MIWFQSIEEKLYCTTILSMVNLALLDIQSIFEYIYLKHWALRNPGNAPLRRKASTCTYVLVRKSVTASVNGDTATTLHD
ncbi:uncharacterized protein LY89DRAFT_504347 [Mollisia scopiformis]|uniref:Uncharacterized protein n=1 Tax=Mollisia scopiformis TaxID=149040 RepID=A0A194XF43_MOLSC|nr:uncharacterized protein LY89DRAFT_504347 [Mollisia scopiformis]KUJ18754.1 hypothetical protein LY89DRAFT_504347 [Mollisia scopiformis]